uniref:Uncharacterized protein n=1 Tax=Anguilla anguilla TaxID=7936 RepID=A0A0E9UMN5_ANGAN
MSKRICSAVS